MVTISTVNNVVEHTGNTQVEVKCLSTDEKPTKVPINSLLLELDTQKIFYFDGNEWREV